VKTKLRGQQEGLFTLMSTVTKEVHECFLLLVGKKKTVMRAAGAGWGHQVWCLELQEGWDVHVKSNQSKQEVTCVSTTSSSIKEEHSGSHHQSRKNLDLFLLLLFICAYKAWVISPPCPHPLPYHPLRHLPLPPTPSIPSRNYFALISNFVIERV
jgi:hypothetical protein